MFTKCEIIYRSSSSQLDIIPNGKNFTKKHYFKGYLLFVKLGHNLNLTKGSYGMSKKHLSFIESYSKQFNPQETQKIKGKNLKPGDTGFYKPEAESTLFRSWQVNPETGATCYTINRYFEIERIVVEPKFRIFFQNYRLFNTFLSYDHAVMVRDEILKLMEAKQYELYGITKQMELFPDKPQAEFRVIHALKQVNN